ncbi:MAG: LysM peptidoglycan-binding domain-containing protein [Verrucomicrobiales bacterium]|nr:LysM peptidoglycan-binding domain-containing protein [Verrucomicrobiales bacterium]
MSEPFAFLDDEEENEEGGIAWLPLSLAAIALAGFLSIPLLGLFKAESTTDNWNRYAEGEELAVEIAAEDNSGPVVESLEPLLTPDPVDLTTDLTSVDETLASLGNNSSTTATEAEQVKKVIVNKVKTSDAITAKQSPAKKIVKELRKEEGIASVQTNSDSARRLPRVERPAQKSIAAQATEESRDLVVQPGDTLYSISRRTGSSPEEIARLNGTDPSKPIRVGQKLRIPGEDRAQAQSPRNSNPKREISPVGSSSKIRRGWEYPASVEIKPRKASKNEKAVVGKSVLALPRPGAVSPVPEQDMKANPLDKYNNAVAYRVQRFDSLERIADALATTPEELIEINGRSRISQGEMLVVPVDNCMVKD